MQTEYCLCNIGNYTGTYGKDLLALKILNPLSHPPTPVACSADRSKAVVLVLFFHFCFVYCSWLYIVTLLGKSGLIVPFVEHSSLFSFPYGRFLFLLVLGGLRLVIVALTEYFSIIFQQLMD